MDLLTLWSNFEPGTAPYVAAEDVGVISACRPGDTVIHTSWSSASSAPDFAEPGDSRLHLGLLPMPFVGDLRRASVYLLLLNPGLSSPDYFGEYEVADYRSALLRNLRQQWEGDEVPFMFLNPRWAWHGDYWHSKLAGVIKHLSGVWDSSFASARLRLASEIAAIEMMPYHSATFRGGRKLLRDLPSAKAARLFVSEYVVPRVRSGEAIVIAMRQARKWSLPDIPGVVTYSGSEARSAHLTPKSRGGQAVLAHLTK